MTATKETTLSERKARDFELIARYQAGDDRAIEELLTLYHRFIHKTANSYRKKFSALDYEDIAQECRLGFVRAARKFDTAKGFSFMTYAQRWMLALMQRLVQRDLMIAIPLYVQERAAAADYGATIPVCVHSLDALCGDDEDSSTLGELQVAPVDVEEEALGGTDPRVDDIKTALPCLPVRERELFEAYFGLGDYGPMSYGEVAKEFGLTKEGVRHIIFRAARRVRQHLRGQGYTFDEVEA